MENNLTGNRRVALYVRTATEPASGEVPAYAVQEAHLRDVAASNSTFQIVGVYRDIACSGTDTPKLPELQRLLSDCRTGRVDDININGWFVGFITSNDNDYFFATNISLSENDNQFSSADGLSASKISLSILRDHRLYAYGYQSE